MTSNEQTILAFETRVRQMILHFKQLKKENQDLLAQIEKDKQDIADLQAKLTQADNDYNSLKMAKMMQITDGDLEGAKARVNKMIKNVNKCIAILSDEQ
jgi:predicted RNase H-like nuclease (RuvC/YqgF family)